MWSVRVAKDVQGVWEGGSAGMEGVAGAAAWSDDGGRGRLRLLE